MFWLGFDVDRIGAAIDWSDRNAPAPTLTITNPENGHAHLLYALETSIRTAPDGKMKPLKYAAAVENALRKKLGADTGYSGLICKNPNHSNWKIAVWQPELYTLDWLADSLDLSAANDKDIVADYGLGRNCTLFDKTRKWAYRAIRQGWPEYEQWLQACYERANAYNKQLLTPLDLTEVQGIAKSISKWTFKHFSNDVFSLIQSKRGKKGGLLSGETRRAGSLEESKPWDILGISRRTFFYRKKNG